MQNRCISFLILGLIAIWGCKTSGHDALPGLPAQPGSGAGATQVAVGRTNFGPAELLIEITDPMSNAVLVPTPAPEIKVRVRSIVPGTKSEPAADPIDPATVRFTLQRQSDVEPVTQGGLMGPGQDSIYLARVDLARAESGLFALTVGAATRGGRRGRSVVQVRVDRGPRVKIISPRDGQPVKGEFTAQVQVDYSPFEAGGEITATLANAPVTFKAAGPNLFEAVVDLGKYQPPLFGEQLLKVVATNVMGSRADASARFVVDAAGPVISATEPPAGAVIGGIVRISAKVADTAGVLGTTVIAVLGHKGADANFTLELKPESPGVYSVLFDTARLRTCGPPLSTEAFCNVFPTISFRAADQLGNETTLSYEVAVDNRPPIVELDPSPIRLLKVDPKRSGYVCSISFKPNGNYANERDMPYDLCAVPQTFDFRAWAEDDGNYARGLRGTPIASIDPSTVAAFVQQDTTQPLVVDTDGDGICDDINPKLVPGTRGPFSSNQVLKLNLGPLAPAGRADFLLKSKEPAMGCLAPEAELQPSAVCPSHEPARNTMVIAHPDILRGPYPSVWTVETTTPGDPFCLGSQFDTFANGIADDRWLCVAVAATDKVGNHGVSNPLRLYLDQRGLRSQAPAAARECPRPRLGAPAPPSCTGTYDRATNTVSARPCKAPRFTFPEDRREYYVVDRGTDPGGK